jgi:hypothetical protein
MTSSSPGSKFENQRVIFLQLADIARLVGYKSERSTICYTFDSRKMERPISNEHEGAGIGVYGHKPQAVCHYFVLQHLTKKSRGNYGKQRLHTEVLQAKITLPMAMVGTSAIRMRLNALTSATLTPPRYLHKQS